MEHKCTELSTSLQQVGSELCKMHSFLASKLQCAAWLALPHLLMYLCSVWGTLRVTKIPNQRNKGSNLRALQEKCHFTDALCAPCQHENGAHRFWIEYHCKSSHNWSTFYRDPACVCLYSLTQVCTFTFVCSVYAYAVVFALMGW